MAPQITLKQGAAEDEYNLATRKRSQLRKKITLMTDKVSGWRESLGEVTLEEAASTERNLADLNARVEVLNKQISLLLKNPVSTEETEARDVWEERVEEYAEKVQTALGTIEIVKFRLKDREAKADQPSLSTSQSSEQTATVPRDVVVKQERKIPKFCGDAKRFKEWFGLYQSAVKECSTLEKFEKLKGCLTGDAWKAIAHLELTEEFYETAMDIIKDEYGSIFSAQYAYSQEFIKLCSGKGIRSPDKWHVAIPSISQNIKALQTLVPHFDGTAVVLLPMMLDNLPSSVRESFLRTHEVSNSEEALLQLEALLKFLSKESKIRATASGSKVPDSNASREKFNARDRPSTFAQQKARDNNTFLGAQASEGDHSCIFCNGKNHVSTKCKKNVNKFRESRHRAKR